MKNPLLFLTLALQLVVLWSMLSACDTSSLSFSLSTADQPTPHVSSSQYSLLGPPTVSASFINQVLSAYHSPASGLGQTMLADGLHFHLDPVYALAWFLHEDGMGTTGWGAVNKSLGNTRCSLGYTCRGGYRAYASWAAGFYDWFSLISVQYVSIWHLTTVAHIVPVYAPSSDHNDVQAYISAIEHAVDTWRAGHVLV